MVIALVLAAIDDTAKLRRKASTTWTSPESRMITITVLQDLLVISLAESTYPYPMPASGNSTATHRPWSWNSSSSAKPEI
jgi:hypothetical protein